MLKKRAALLTAVLLLVGTLLSVFAPVFAEETSNDVPDLAPNALSAILIDADTGTVLYEKNPHDQLQPASITKVMTMLLIMEAIDSGVITMDEKVTTSEYAASMGGSQIFLEAGETMTVEEMLKGIAMASGNDASVAMAEKIAGSEEMFVKKMNERAQELGLKNTHFVNSSGLPAENHYSSAYDIAIMSKELLKHEEVTKYTGQYEDYLRKNTDNPFWLVNTNKLVRFYSGADGLKTGYTSSAKFCLTATAKRDDMRVIAVVLGVPNAKTRNLEVSKMFDYAFAQYKIHPIFSKGDEMGTHRLDKASIRDLEFLAEQNYSVLMKKSDSAENIRHELVIEEDLKLPIAKGDTIAKLKVYNGDTLIREFPVASPDDIKKANWWQLLKRTSSKLFMLD